MKILKRFLNCLRSSNAKNNTRNRASEIISMDRYNNKNLRIRSASCGKKQTDKTSRSNGI